MYKIGQELRMNDGSLIRINRTINATTFEFTVLQTGRQLIDELLSKAQAISYNSPPPAYHGGSTRRKASAWIASILNENNKEQHNAR